MSKNSSAIYITKISKKDYKKRLLKKIRIFPKTKKNKSNNMGVKNIKIPAKMKNKN